jgi:hypothetical protein
MAVVIEDVNIWAKTKGAKDMLAKYTDEIGAVFDYVSKHKDGFLMKECKSLINQMCAEARRTLRRGTKDVDDDSSADEATVILDSSVEIKSKRKLSDDENDSEAELAARDLAESNEIKKSLFKNKAYESYSESDLVFAD